jgi:YfiH family protein
MPYQENNGIRYFTFESLAGVSQAIFTRQGGVSPAPWDSLNMGGGVGDDIAHVRENRIRAFNALDRNPESIHDVWLVHGTDVIHAQSPRNLNLKAPLADIIITDNPEVTLFMRYADCVPLLFHDPQKGVVALGHAGWMGTVRGVAKVVVHAMQEHYGTNPENMMAGIGPAIGPDHYEVGEDVAGQVRNAFGARADELLQPRGDRFMFDLWLANRIQLQEAGVVHIETAGICTACHTNDWYSHRAEKGRTGRFGALIGL